nr:MerR family transcriptional regulator [uncultured Blautia sp.]
MKIGEAAKETGLSISNIRFYEKKGLLEPARDQESKYRNYTEEDILRLKKIIIFRKMDLSVEQIAAMLRGKTDVKEVLKNQEQELLNKIREMEGALELCRILEKEEVPLDIEPEQYLDYIAQEEKKGKKFSKAEELLDGMLESAEALSGGMQSVGFWGEILGSYAWLGKYLNLIFWLLVAGGAVFALITREPSARNYLYWGGLLLFLLMRVSSYWKNQSE